MNFDAGISEQQGSALGAERDECVVFVLVAKAGAASTSFFIKASVQRTFARREFAPSAPLARSKPAFPLPRAKERIFRPDVTLAPSFFVPQYPSESLIGRSRQQSQIPQSARRI